MSSPDERNIKRARKFLPSLQHFSALQLADGVGVIAASEKFPSAIISLPSPSNKRIIIISAHQRYLLCFLFQ